MISPSQDFWTLEMNFHFGSWEFLKILRSLEFLGQKCRNKPCPIFYKNYVVGKISKVSLHSPFIIVS